MSGGETCDTDVLNTDTGPVNLRAEFEPETIDLRWYNNNTLVNVTSAQGECTYDSPITLPTNPTKPGYKFKGWKVVPEYNFSTFDVNTPKTNALAKSTSGCFKPWQDVTCDNQFSDLNSGEWKLIFSYGTVYGMSACSTSNTTTPTSGNSGRYCWCKATGHKPTNSNILYKPSATLPWVFSQSYDSRAACESRCAFACSANTTSSYLLILYGQSSS